MTDETISHLSVAEARAVHVHVRACIIALALIPQCIYIYIYN